MTSEDDRKTARHDARSLRTAIRRARLSEAEHNDVISGLRESEHARLELLHDELRPVFDDVPDGDQFDCALVPGERPRLWIDMLAYVTMAPDKRTYRFIKDGREGRRVMHETADLADMADRVTDYIAHRVIERERALESDRDATLARAGARAVQAPAQPPALIAGHGGIALALFFLAGFVAGVVALFILGIVAGGQ